MIRKILCILGFHKTKYVYACGCSYSIECKYCKKDLNDQLEKYDTDHRDYYITNHKGTFKKIHNIINVIIEKLKRLK